MPANKIVKTSAPRSPGQQPPLLLRWFLTKPAIIYRLPINFKVDKLIKFYHPPHQSPYSYKLPLSIFIQMLEMVSPSQLRLPFMLVILKPSCKLLPYTAPSIWSAYLGIAMLVQWAAVQTAWWDLCHYHQSPNYKQCIVGLCDKNPTFVTSQLLVMGATSRHRFLPAGLSRSPYHHKQICGMIQ